jgi:hypothetical protein
MSAILPEELSRPLLDVLVVVAVLAQKIWTREAAISAVVLEILRLKTTCSHW